MPLDLPSSSCRWAFIQVSFPAYDSTTCSFRPLLNLDSRSDLFAVQFHICEICSLGSSQRRVCRNYVFYQNGSCFLHYKLLSLVASKWPLTDATLVLPGCRLEPSFAPSSNSAICTMGSQAPLSRTLPLPFSSAPFLNFTCYISAQTLTFPSQMPPFSTFNLIPN